MKSEEYAKNFIEELESLGEEEAVGNLAKALFLEIEDIMKQRKAKKNSAMLSILNEQINKWKSICRKVEKSTGVNYLNPDGYKQFLENRLGIVIGII